jgi:hypothetical protein
LHEEGSSASTKPAVEYYVVRNLANVMGFLAKQIYFII